METIPKNYKLYRRTKQLAHLKPKEVLKWIKRELLSSLGRKREETPITIAIEVTNNCNLTCSTCPHSYLSPDEKGFMNMDLFERIVDECCQFSALTSIVFTGFGEPLLHPQLISMSCYVKDKRIPIVRTYTNGILLKEKSEDILLRSGFDEITLSLNGATQTIYEKITNSLQYVHVTDNFKYFLQKRKALKRWKPFVNLKLLKLNDVSFDKEEFIRNWKPLLKSGDCISIKESHSFAGQVNDPRVGKVFKTAKRVPCGQLWNVLFIAWNGDVTPCCVDLYKKLKIGSCCDSSLLDLWHSSKLAHMRNIHLQRRYDQMPLCDHCETWRYFT